MMVGVKDKFYTKICLLVMNRVFKFRELTANFAIIYKRCVHVTLLAIWLAGFVIMREHAVRRVEVQVKFSEKK